MSANLANNSSKLSPSGSFPLSNPFDNNLSSSDKRSLVRVCVVSVPPLDFIAMSGHTWAWSASTSRAVPLISLSSDSPNPYPSMSPVNHTIIHLTRLTFSLPSDLHSINSMLLSTHHLRTCSRWSSVHCWSTTAKSKQIGASKSLSPDRWWVTLCQVLAKALTRWAYNNITMTVDFTQNSSHTLLVQS